MQLIQLNYHDLILEAAQDLYTFNVNTDLMIDLDIWAIQSSHNTLILDFEQQVTIAVLYMSRYSAFDVELIK